MRIYPDMVKAALWRNKYRASTPMLPVFLLVPLAAWAGQGTPVSALHPQAALPVTRHLDLTGTITSAIQGMCLAGYPEHGGKGGKGGLIVSVVRCRHLSAQRWTLPGDNTIRNGGECLTVTKKTTATGAVLATCDGSARQFWEPDGIVRNPAIELLNPWSGKCLDDPGGSEVDGTQVRIYACTRSPEQIWYLPR
jgi:hypothetical protein